MGVGRVPVRNHALFLDQIAIADEDRTGFGDDAHTGMNDRFTPCS